MGTTLTSIHIYGQAELVISGFRFLPFSENWLTCVEDFTEKDPSYSYKAAKLISKSTKAPVLHFGIFDSELICFTFFCDGKVAAKYSDEEFAVNKKLYDIPGMVGHGDGQKKRLSTILQCADVDLKVELLEEYLGVCLCYHPDLLDAPHMLFRERSDVCYQKYLEAEKQLTGKAAPMAAKLVAEYPGKLFWDFLRSAFIKMQNPIAFCMGMKRTIQMR